MQPDAARAGEGGEKNAVSAEDHVANAGDARDLKRDIGLEGADVAGMHAEHFSGREVASDDFAGKLQPGGAVPGHALKDESVAAEDAGAERLLESDAEGDLGSTSRGTRGDAP